MLAYRTHIYSLAMAASAEVTKFAVDLSNFLADRQLSSDRQGTLNQHLPELKINAQSLRSAVNKLERALPAEVREDIVKTYLRQHLYWIGRRLNEGLPAACVNDPIDIVSRDLPDVLRLFERWYERQSPTHDALSARVNPQIENGELNSALREAWPFFKTRMVEAFELDDDLDGEKLATKLFGNTGATSELLPSVEREGYMNLFKGLYALNRNPVSHNDVKTNPEYAAAVLALINATLLRIEDALDQSKSNSTGGLSD